MASENPYLPPESTVQASFEEAAIEVPAEILGKIKGAWVAAIVSAGMTLVLVLASLFGTTTLGFNTWALFDVGLILCLAFGIYKKSRTCAVFMLVYFLVGKIILMVQGAPAASIPVALIFTWFYFQGVQGTFRYHALLKEARAAAGNG